MKPMWKPKATEVFAIKHKLSNHAEFVQMKTRSERQPLIEQLHGQKANVLRS